MNLFKNPFKAIHGWIEGTGANTSRLRRYRPLINDSFDRNIDGGVRDRVSSNAKWIFDNVPEVRSIVCSKATFSVTGGFVPQCRSTNKPWANLAETFFFNWSRECSLDRKWSFQELLWLASVDIDVAGEIFYLLTENAQGYPLLLPIRSHAIKDDGTKLSNQGVIKDKVTGEATGYLLCTSRDDEYNEQFTTLPAQSVIHLLDGQSTDQTRGLSAFASSQESILNASDVKHWEVLAARIGAMHPVIKRNASGEAEEKVDFDYEDGVDNQGNPKPIPVETLVEGQINYLAEGEEIFQFKNDRPGDAYHRLLESLYRSASQSLQWSYEIAFTAEKLSGPAVHLELAKIQNTCKRRQQLLAKFANKVWFYVIGRAVEQGLLPKAPLDFANVDWTMPKRPSITVNRDIAGEILALRAGTTTYTEIYSALGLDAEEQLTRKAEEASLINRLAKQHGVSPAEIVQLSPNEARPTEQPPAGTKQEPQSP